MIYKSTISAGLQSTIYTVLGPNKLSTIYNILGLTVYNLQANVEPNLQSTQYHPPLPTTTVILQQPAFIIRTFKEYIPLDWHEGPKNKERTPLQV